MLKDLLFVFISFLKSLNVVTGFKKCWHSCTLKTCVLPLYCMSPASPFCKFHSVIFTNGSQEKPHKLFVSHTPFIPHICSAAAAVISLHNLRQRSENALSVLILMHLALQNQSSITIWPVEIFHQSFFISLNL